MKTPENLKVYETYFYNEYDESEHEHWYFRNEKDAENKYDELCKEHGIEPSFCFSDEDGITIGYGSITIQ